MKKNNSLSLIIFFVLYFFAWVLVLPCLFLIKSLKPFKKQRFGMGMPQGPFDLWIHAASVGEAKLALKVLSKLQKNKYKKVLITTITSQGMDTLCRGNKQKASLAYFPLDFIFLMPWCLNRIQPRKLLLLETEIWPGLLRACRKKSIPAVIGNARMSLKSFCRYLPLAKILNELSPETIITVSNRDQDRFSAIFKKSQIKTMANIKFDLMENQSPVPYIHNPLSSFIKPGQPFIVLGSIRREEEIKIQWLIKKINRENPKTTIALFPRHMKRLAVWENFLNRQNIAWIHRSKIVEKKTSSYDVILWDQFGELVHAYALAKSVYVGGTLVPCGGQNFLEPISQGVIPCIGPFWDNFHWVGKDFLSTGLIHQISDERELYSKLVAPGAYSKEKIMERFNHFLSGKRNGTLKLISTIS